MKFIFIILGGVGSVYALIKKPEIIAVLLFTVLIAQINISFIRPVLVLALFVRVIADKSTQKTYPPFLSLTYVKILVFFLLYGLLVSLWQDSFNYELVKGVIDTVMLSYCVYHFYFKNQGNDQLKLALIISGLICFADLTYTYVVFGTFPIHRLYNTFTGMTEEMGDDDIFSGTNWNFFGQICGMCFVYVLRDYIKNRSAKKLSLIILPLMLLGVIISTSRSAIMGLIIVTIFIVLNTINYSEQKRRLSKIAVLITGAGMIAFLLFAVAGKYLNLDSKFVDEVSSRLTEEPLAIIKKATGQSYNINNLGSMDWREESAENAYAAYLNEDLTEQLFGIGTYGFEKRNMGNGFNAHNATLLLLIEYGLIGFLIFFILIGGIIIQSMLKKNFTPSLMVIIFIIIYGLGQNREWTSWTMYLFVFSVAAELQFIRIKTNLIRKGVPMNVSALKPATSL